MLLETVFERFVQESPASVMVRALLENVLQPGPLDELFERTPLSSIPTAYCFPPWSMSWVWLSQASSNLRMPSIIATRLVSCDTQVFLRKTPRD